MLADYKRKIIGVDWEIIRGMLREELLHTKNVFSFGPDGILFSVYSTLADVGAVDVLYDALKELCARDPNLSTRS